MSKVGQQQVIKKPISLLLVEGKTDEIFYNRVKSEPLRDCRSTIQDVGGLYNINAKVIDRIYMYLQQHTDEIIRIYCCFDRESRYGQVPGFDIIIIKKHFKDQRQRRILSIDLITATKQIESWLFYDLDTIYKFLRVPNSQRRPRAYQPPEKFGYRDLQQLFERYGKTYSKGKGAEYFINSLNINKIGSTCEELREGIELIQSQANDMTNHLFSSRNRKSN